MNTNHLIILDRDGVINFDSDNYIRSPDDWRPIPGSLEAIADLCRHGFRIAICTNQSGIGRGYYDEATLAQIHNKMLNAIRGHGGHVSHIRYCPHHPRDTCRCRKPAPGMLLDTLKYFGIDANQAVFVGDSLRDMQAAISAQIKPIHVLTGYGRECQEDVAALGVADRFSDLAAVAAYLTEASV